MRSPSDASTASTSSSTLATIHEVQQYLTNDLLASASPSPIPANDPLNDPLNDASHPEGSDPPGKTFFVESILGRRWNKQTRRREYLVKWSGYEGQDTWEPKHDFKDPHFVAEFDETFNQTTAKPSRKMPKRNVTHNKRYYAHQSAAVLHLLPIRPAPPNESPVNTHPPHPPPPEESPANTSNSTTFISPNKNPLSPPHIHTTPNWTPYIQKISIHPTLHPSSGERWKNMRVLVLWKNTVEMEGESEEGSRQCFVAMDTAMDKFGRLLAIFISDKIQFGRKCLV
ncbi:hypothetical protein HDU98_012305 [Podochytrium sp. JEL0797]|nr:hypothetical protein HDU98_012305 [Podochytrium sp. JEL0797]